MLSAHALADPTKFFGFELGSISKYDKDTDKAVVNGAHDTSKMFELLNKFIEMFVLCPNCKYVSQWCTRSSPILLPPPPCPCHLGNRMCGIVRCKRQCVASCCAYVY
jgi:hypothetical protein